MSNASDGLQKYYDWTQQIVDKQNELNNINRNTIDGWNEYERVQEDLNAMLAGQQAIYRGLSEDEKARADAIAPLLQSLPELQEKSALCEEKLSYLAESMSSLQESSEPAAEATTQLADSMEKAQEISNEGLGTGFAESLEDIPETASTAMAGATEAITAGGEAITSAVTDAGTQSAVGFDTELGKVSESANKAMSDALTAVNSYTGQARSAGYSVGASISQGAAAGVMAYAAQVAAQAAAMVTNAINAAKRAAASNSPSKKMIALGQDLDRGLIIGIKDKESEAISTMEDTLKSVVTPNIKMPEIPDYTQNINIAMRPGNEDATLIDAIAKLADSQRPNIDIDVTQNFDGEQQSYAGQQKAAAKEMKNLARELMR